MLVSKFKALLRQPLKQCRPLYRQYNRWRGWRLHEPDAAVAFTNIGGDGGPHDYGAWVVPNGLLDARSIVYSFGVGEDISFDLELMRRFGCRVFAYDPTPAAAKFIERLVPGPNFVFSQLGLAAVDGVAEFAETHPDESAFAMTGGEMVRNGVVRGFHVSRLSSLMAANGHDHIDLLKMDIEGFEYDVIDDMLQQRLFPRCVLLEFHHYQRKDPAATRRSVRKLTDVGYRRFWISELGAEYGFVLD